MGSGSDGIDPNEFNQVSQLSHYGWGLAVIWGTVCLFGTPFMWYALATWAVATAVKEFYYDDTYETAAVRGSSMQDFLFYQAGAFTAVASVLAKAKYFS